MNASKWSSKECGELAIKIVSRKIDLIYHAMYRTGDRSAKETWVYFFFSTNNCKPADRDERGVKFCRATKDRGLPESVRRTAAREGGDKK